MPSPPLHGLSPRPPTAGPNLNALTPVILQTDPASETAEQRTTRDLRTCQELIELGMALARTAAERATQDMTAPPPATPMPGSAAAALEQAEARARLRTPNYGTVFARIARAIRQTIALKALIAAGMPASRPAVPRTPGISASPHATHPERPDQASDDADRPDWHLPRGADGHVPIETMLLTLREDLGPEQTGRGLASVRRTCARRQHPKRPGLIRPARTHPARTRSARAAARTLAATRRSQTIGVVQPRSDCRYA